jgi:hypothetical protein
MTLRISHLVAALLLLSLDGNQVSVKAADCTDDEQVTIDESYDSIEYDVATICGAEVCTTDCQDELLNVEALPDCTSSDGTNYYEWLLTSYACAESSTSTSASMDNACSEDVETETFDMISNYEPDTCEETPCETSCYNLLAELSSSLVSCTTSDGYNYADYYSSWIESCSETSTSAESSTTSSTASASTSSATGSSGSTAASATGSSGSTEATSSTESTTSSETTDEKDTAESSASAASASSSVSASKDNAAASVSGSALSSLVVAGTLALLAIQS